MVLRCSLLGHNYGEPEVDREREERGSEVVLTVTEFEACQRCGERNVISENTEVTSIVPGEAPARSPDGPEESVGQPSPSPSGVTTNREHEPNPTGSADSRTEPTAAGPTTAEASTEERTEATADSDDETIEVPTDENGDPIVDDGEILEDDGEAVTNSGDRQHGEWPDSADVGPPVESADEPTAWPDDEQDQAQAESGADLEDHARTIEDQPEDDAVILESGSDSNSDSGPTTTETGKQFDYSVDSTGESDPNSVPDTEAVTDGDTAQPRPEHESASAESTGPETGIASAQSAPVPGENSPTDGTTTEFFCPQCDFVAPGDSGSLRTGDICPECKKGYLGERTA